MKCFFGIQNQTKSLTLSNNMSQQEIQQIKDQIHDLKEYLYSDLCKACGDAVLSLEKISQRLNELESQQNS